MKNSWLRRLFSVTAIVGGVAMISVPVSDATSADPNTPTMPGSPGDEGASGDHHGRGRFHPGQHIEGRIAFLKAELKITAAQEALWDKLADTMRQDTKAMNDAFAAMRQQREQGHETLPSALTHLEWRANMAQLHAQASQSFLTAFKPLYGALTDDQKRAADELLGRRHWR